MFDGNVGRSKILYLEIAENLWRKCGKVVSPHSLRKIYAESGNNAEISYSNFGRCLEFRL